MPAAKRMIAGDDGYDGEGRHRGIEVSVLLSE